MPKKSKQILIMNRTLVSSLQGSKPPHGGSCQQSDDGVVVDNIKFEFSRQNC